MSDSFANRLRTARDLRKLSQAELAEKTGLPVSSISHFESNSRKPSFENLKLLAMKLEVSTDYLLALADSPQKAAADDPLFRHGHALSDHDRTIAQKLIEVMAEASRAKAKGKG